MVAEGLSDLTPNLRKRLTTGWNEIRSELLPDITGTASLNLLGQLGVELVFADTEERAAEQVSRICISAGMLGLDVETAPRSEFLPVRWPIAITRDGRRSKVQAAMNTSAALDPFRAEVRLLQVAAEIDRRTVALVIDLRRVPLRSPML